MSGEKTSGPLPIDTPVLIPIHSIAMRLRDIAGFRNQGDPPLYSLVSKGETTFMRLVVIASDSEDERDQQPKILRRAKTYVTGLAVITFGHIWLEPVLLSEDLEILWREPRRLAPIKDKEIDASGPIDIQEQDVAYSTQLAGWISAQYPQVLILHNSGLFHMRSSLAYDFADYYYAEAVVAFYRIVEAVTARRLGIRKPELKDVIQEARALALLKEDEQSERARFTEAEISQIYVIRSGPSAHGAELAVVTREEAAEAKLLAETMVVYDYLARRGGAIDVGGPIRRWQGRRRQRRA